MVACECRLVEFRSSSTVGSASEKLLTARKIDRTYQHVVLGGQRGGLIRAEVVEVISLTGQGDLDMIDDRLGDRGNV